MKCRVFVLFCAYNSDPQLTTDCAQKWPAFNRAPHYAPTPTLLNRTRPIKRAPKASARPDRGPYVGGPWLGLYRSVHHQRGPQCEIRYRAPVQGGNGPLSHLKLKSKVTSNVEVEGDAAQQVRYLNTANQPDFP